MVKLLLDHGADVDLRNNDGWTALMNACGRGYNDIVKLLLAKGADPNIQRVSSELH
jgi:ankyrin repeat protein